MEKSSNVDVVTPKQYGVISQHYGVISSNHDSFFLSTIFAVHGLAESVEKRSFVLFRVSPYHLFVSQAYGWWAKTLANTFLWQRHFWTFGRPTFPGCVRKKKPPDSGTFFVRNTYLKIYIYIYYNNIMITYVLDEGLQVVAILNLTIYESDSRADFSPVRISRTSYLRMWQTMMHPAQRCVDLTAVANFGDAGKDQNLWFFFGVNRRVPAF